MREDMKRQGKTHIDISEIPPLREFWSTEEDLKNRNELRKR